jgi:hypothetical protein
MKRSASSDKVPASFAGAMFSWVLAQVLDERDLSGRAV